MATVLIMQNLIAVPALVLNVQRIVNAALVRLRVAQVAIVLRAQVTPNAQNLLGTHNVILGPVMNVLLETIALVPQSQHHNASHTSARVVQVIVAAPNFLRTSTAHRILAQNFAEFANLTLNA